MYISDYGTALINVVERSKSTTTTQHTNKKLYRALCTCQCNSQLSIAKNHSKLC